MPRKQDWVVRGRFGEESLAGELGSDRINSPLRGDRNMPLAGDRSVLISTGREVVEKAACRVLRCWVKLGGSVPAGNRKGERRSRHTMCS